MDLREKIYDLHDNVVNQKYDGTLPYSFHLKAVEAQFDKFKYLIEDEYVTNDKNSWSIGVKLVDILRVAVQAHDIQEDCRYTYNDTVKLIEDYFGNYGATLMCADIIYCLTDEKGKTRAERKNEKYYKELKENKYAVFVKLCDIAANTLYSKLMNSSMYKTYKKEFPKFKEKVYIEEYEELFNYIENL